jgi:hypothetical protein
MYMGLWVSEVAGLRWKDIGMNSNTIGERFYGMTRSMNAPATSGLNIVPDLT